MGDSSGSDDQDCDACVLSRRRLLNTHRTDSSQTDNRDTLHWCIYVNHTSDVLGCARKNENEDKSQPLNCSRGCIDCCPYYPTVIVTQSQIKRQYF